MDRIEQSSRDIATITAMIDEIAFQTNLLALNAGVEAARAGDAGRGFSVVATEVRALSQRAASAAKEIEQLIVRSSGEIQSGVKHVTAAGEALHQIFAQVSDIETVVAEVAKGATEQSLALKQVSVVIDGMDKETQRNAAMAEETNAATQNLRQQIKSLVEGVVGFKTEAGEPGYLSRRPAGHAA